MYEGPLEPVSNDEDWVLSIAIVSDEDGLPFPLSDVVATIRVSDALGGERLTGSSTDGTIVIDTAAGAMVVTVPAARLACFEAGLYSVALRIAAGSATTQLMRADLPILEGGF
jgi:hypothetical protein